MKIAVIGAGYVGLVSATCFAELGHEVICVEAQPERLKILQQGQCPLYEPGLEKLLLQHCQSQRLQFTADIKVGVSQSEIIFIAVGTPPAADGSADLSDVKRAAEQIGSAMEDYRLIVNKSTVPVGTAEMVQDIITQQLRQRQKTIAFDVASNPEFLREGRAIKDFMQPDRIVIGVQSEKAQTLLQTLYEPFKECLIAMDVRSAELTKYAANAFLAAKIGFINEMSQIAEKVGADIENIRRGIGSDHRIGPHFLNAGCGYGGSCFPKDVQALEAIAQKYGVETKLLKAIEEVNYQQKRHLFNKLMDYFKGQLKGKVFALWGLAFKPETDDIREAPSRVLLDLLWQQGATVKVYDPVAMPVIKQLYGKRSDLVLCETALKAAEEAQALIIVTEWDEFYKADLNALKQNLRAPVIFDGRNLYDPKELAQLGWEYYAIGRSSNF